MKDTFVLAGLGAFGAFVAMAKPLSSAMVIRLAYTAGLLNNIYVTLAPAKACELYGVTSSPFRNFLWERSGMINLNTYVAAWMLFAKEADVATAIGMGSLVSAIIVLQSSLNEQWKQFGGKSMPHYFLLFAAVGTTYLTVFADDANEEVRDLFIKLFVLMRVVHGVMFAIFPKNASEAYAGITVEDADLNDIQLMGTFSLGCGIFVGGIYMVDSLTNEQAFGLSFIPMLAWGVLNHFIFEKGSGEDNFQFAWMTLQLLVVGTLLVGAGEEAQD